MVFLMAKDLSQPDVISGASAGLLERLWSFSAPRDLRSSLMIPRPTVKVCLSQQILVLRPPFQGRLDRLSPSSQVLFNQASDHSLVRCLYVQHETGMGSIQQQM